MEGANQRANQLAGISALHPTPILQSHAALGTNNFFQADFMRQHCLLHCHVRNKLRDSLSFICRFLAPARHECLQQLYPVKRENKYWHASRRRTLSAAANLWRIQNHAKCVVSIPAVLETGHQRNWRWLMGLTWRLSCSRVVTRCLYHLAWATNKYKMARPWSMTTRMAGVWLL